MSDTDKCPACQGYPTMPRMVHDTDPPHECTHEFHKERPPVAVEAETITTTGAAVNVSVESQDTPAARRPRCPYCNFDGGVKGAQISMQHGRLTIIVVRCGNDECRKILGVFQPLELTMVQPGPGGQPS